MRVELCHVSLKRKILTKNKLTGMRPKRKVDPKQFETKFKARPLQIRANVIYGNKRCRGLAPVLRQTLRPYPFRILA